VPIGENQTISQPYIVAHMTEALELKGSEHVLEIGTGSGYQTAILADLARRVCTVERIKALQERAREILVELRYYNVVFKVSDGTWGWEEQGPYDAILVTAGAPTIPQPLVDSLVPGGRMIVPVGRNRQAQNLIKIVKDESGNLKESSLGGCRFVDLIGEHGFSESESC
jgi:protein-L-isoaspartate(D-aspartate) O-methyltransferase